MSPPAIRGLHGYNMEAISSLLVLYEQAFFQ
jgi:hypothetical protein